MAQNTLGMNMSLPIYNGDGTSFNGLELKNFTVESLMMSLSDKITGYVMYNDNALGITMDEYVEYKRNPSDENEDAVRYVLVNPPTIVREGTVADNGTNKGATKYSFTFYHPMYILSDMPFSDVAVNSSQELYLSQNNKFSWIGNLTDFVAKLNKNLQGTEWTVVIHGSVPQQDITKKSEVLSFDGSSIAEAIKKGYEEWKVPYVVDTVERNSALWRQGKRFVVQYGLPTQEIIGYNANGEPTGVPFVFRFGQGVGLKNNSRTPRNNKIITRIAGYGSEDNIQYGYPQIPYEGGECAYPLYYGVVNGQRTQLIKHPFTRNHLMPSIYRETVNKKVNPMADGYNPNIEIKDYYDADNTYPNSIKPSEPSYELHEFEVKPELGEKALVGVSPYETEKTRSGYMTKSSFLGSVLDRATATDVEAERNQMLALYNSINANTPYNSQGQDEKYSYQCTTNTHYGESGSLYADIDYMSSNFNFSATIELVASQNEPSWDDSIDDNGDYVQSYFEITIPILQFDLYACAAATQEMSVNMRSGDCLGCNFQVQVDWDDYKRNFYDENGNFSPNGSQRDLNKYPNSSLSQITLILQKETTTFGTLMPNIYQNPNVGDKFVFLGISLPQSYVLDAESRLDDEMMEYMRENNVYYFDYPLKFSEHFLASHTNILWQMKPNVIVRFQFAGETLALYVRQMTVKYNNTALPSYDITLTDDVEIVLNSIGEVEKEVSNLRVLIGQQGEQDDKNKYLRKDRDDTAFGTIRHTKGIQIGGRFTTGLLGEGGVFRKEEDGTTYLETDKLYVRMKLYSDSVEVKKYLHSGGNRSASKGGGVVCSRVEYIDANGDVTTNPNNAAIYRCYFKASDNDKKVTNDFVVGDMAFCRETNIDAGNLGQHGYWRLVVGRNQSGSLTSNNEAWIDLSNRASETIVVGGRSYVHSGYQNGSDVPIAQDDIIQLGNIYDKDRQGAIIEFVSGADSPSYQIFQGIDDFSLNNKNFIGIGYSTQTGRAYMNVFGDAYIGDPNGSTYMEYKQVGQGGVSEMNIKANVTFTSPETHQDTTLEDFATAVVGDLESLQQQIDGSIETWFYGYVPTLNNAPASSWTTAADKNNHLGDLFYDTTTGYAYRFANTGTEQSPVYEWLRITDTDVVKALADAAKAQDTADHKRRVFLVQPTPPYDAGDLWVNATYPANYTGDTDELQHNYKNDVLKCVSPVPRTGVTTFSINDWSLASKYTDDSALINFLTNTYAGDKANLQSQIDGKAETWYQATDPATAWTTAALKAQHAGDLWYNTTNKTTWYYKAATVGGTTTYSWEQQNIPQSVFDSIDGKSSIYVSKPSSYETNDIWIIENTISSSDLPNGCVAGDIVVATSNSSSYNKAHWQKKDRYTDDTTVRAFINSYGTILGITPTAQDVGKALGYLDKVLSTGSTQIDGGLVLTNILYMKDTANTPSVRAGISGLYKSSETGTGYKGYGTAAWFGGGVSNGIPIDHEVSTDPALDYAKILFRFDGSGYIAGGNLAWNAAGNITKFAGQDVEVETLLIGGNSAATQNWVSQNFVTVEFFERLFRAYFGNNTVSTNAPSSTQIDNIEARYSIWTGGDVSALGRGSGGGGGGGVSLNEPLASINSAGLANHPSATGQTIVWNGSTWQYGSAGGGIDMSAVWSALAAATNEQINASHLTTALSGYATSSDLTGYLPLTAGSSKPLTGSLYFSGNSGINWGTSTGMLACAPSSGWTGINSSQWGVGATAYQGVIRTNNNDILHYKAGTTYKVWDESNLDISGYLPLTAGSTNALTGHLYWDRSDATYRILAYDANHVTRYMINLAYSLDSTTNVMTADMTLNSYAYITTTFAPANTVGYQRLSLGSTQKLNAANNMYGIVRMAGQRNPNNASASVYYGSIVPDVLTAARTWTMPDKTGTVALVDDVSGAFTDLTSTNDTNLSVTIGGTTKTITNLYALRLKGVRVTEDAVSYGDLNSLNGTSYSIVTNYNTNSNWQHAPSIQSGLHFGGAVVVRGQDTSLMMQLFWNAKHNESTTPTGKLWFRARASYGWADDWKEIAFADGNIATATALATARTLWGQSFDGTANVSGNMTDVGTIDATGDNTITHSGTTASRFIAKNGVAQVELMVASTNWGVYSRTNSSWIIGTNGTNTFMSVGNVGIANTSPTYNLHVGTTSTSGDVRAVVSNNNGSVGVYSSSNRGLYDFKSGNTGWIIATNGTVTWMPHGNVGIGTTTPEYKLHVSGVSAAQSFRSTVETGTAPMVVASSTLVSNLNADKLDGYDASYFASASDVTTLQGYFDSSGAAKKAVQLKTSRTLWGQSFDGTGNVTGAMTSVGSITCTNNSRISNATGSGGSLYIGRADDAGWVKMSDMCSRQGDSYWKIKSNGDAYFGGVFSFGDVSALSDARKKTFIGDIHLSVEDIASMPAVRFIWNERNDNAIQVGTFAQPWRRILPEVVTERDDVLGMKYGVAALIASIIIAKEVVNHERRITELENECDALRQENVELRKSIESLWHIQ